MSCSTPGGIPETPNGCGPHHVDNSVYTISDGVLLKNGAAYADIVSANGNVLECRLISSNKYLNGQVVKISVSQK